MLAAPAREPVTHFESALTRVGAGMLRHLLGGSGHDVLAALIAARRAKKRF